MTEDQFIQQLAAMGLTECKPLVRYERYSTSLYRTRRYSNGKLTVHLDNSILAYARNPNTKTGQKRVAITDLLNVTSQQLLDLFAQHGNGATLPGTQLIYDHWVQLT